MSVTNIRLIVLAHTKFGEKTLALHTLSDEYGSRSFLVRVGPKTPMAMFLPLNILEADIVPNPKSEFWTARNFQPLTPLSGIRDSYGKNTMSLFLSEVLFRTLREGAREEGLYDWCEQQIRTLDALESSWSNFHLRFLLDLSVALGFRPSREELAPLCETRLPAVSGLLESDFAGAMLIPLSGAARSDIAEALLRYLEIHLEVPIHIRSLAVLRELYQYA